MLSKKTCLGVFFSILAVVSRVAYLICAPIWMDYFKDTSIPILNITNASDTNHTHVTKQTPAENSHRKTNVMFIILAQYLFITTIYSILYLLAKLFRPSLVRNDRGYSHKTLATVGVCQAMSTILLNYSISGTRTAPYLQALLTNCAIPFQFVISYLVLRQQPTLLKLLCALAVFIAEIICLFPTIFPGLESASQHHREGGAVSPAGRIIWPMVYVLSMIPFTTANIYLQKVVQQKSDVNDYLTTRAADMITHTRNVGDDNNSLDDQENRYILENEALEDSAATYSRHGSIMKNPLIQRHQVTGVPQHLDGGSVIYFSFWYCVYLTITVCALFWIDLIPYFGTTKDMKTFGKIMAFNLKCLVGQDGCSASVYSLVWLNCSFGAMSVIAFIGIMKYCEGANFAIIVLAFRTPIAFIFWTLFQESPFMWHPHLALSTWLSIGAICVMFPAVIIYNIGWPWCHRSVTAAELNEDQRAPPEDQ